MICDVVSRAALGSVEGSGHHCSAVSDNFIRVYPSHEPDKCTMQVLRGSSRGTRDRLTVSSVWELFAIEEPGASELNREACEAWKAAAMLAYSQLV